MTELFKCELPLVYSISELFNCELPHDYSMTELFTVVFTS